MKGIVKVVLFGLLAAALGLGVRWLWLEAADVYDSGSTTWYEDAMLEAREMFMEKPDAIQELTALLVEPDEIDEIQTLTETEHLTDNYYLRSYGDYMRYIGDGLTPMRTEIRKALDHAAYGYENGGQILNIAVTDDAVIYYTYYGNGGCAGFLYEKELDETSYFDYVELVENWKLFYDIPA